MKNINLLVASILLMVGSSVANANVITGSIDSVTRFETEVDYWTFSLTDTRSVKIDVFARGFKGSRLNSQIYLFESDVTGDFIASNNNCRGRRCGSEDDSTSRKDSYLSLELLAGDYTLAISNSRLTRAEARSGSKCRQATWW